jgi:hypothetical protein
MWLMARVYCQWAQNGCMEEFHELERHPTSNAVAARISPNIKRAINSKMPKMIARKRNMSRSRGNCPTSNLARPCASTQDERLNKETSHGKRWFVPSEIRRQHVEHLELFMWAHSWI